MNDSNDTRDGWKELQLLLEDTCPIQEMIQYYLNSKWKLPESQFLRMNRINRHNAKRDQFQESASILLP